MALRPKTFRAAAAECHAAAQKVEDPNIKRAYLELMLAWRVLADEADRLISRPANRHDPIIASAA